MKLQRLIRSVFVFAIINVLLFSTLAVSPTTRSLVADNARNWTGKLQESGDYYIIVDSDERPSAYSLTVSIK